ncbi:MAG: helix-turn-helix domain-containing protein [Lachnospiraceae bacterium]|nr:helix-turn-helix domain-containing protein [Lachnospiraceae bacterium]
MTIGERIKKARKDKEMTLQQVADIMDCSPQMISQYENNKRKPKLTTIRRIATALDVTTSELIGSEGTEALALLAKAKELDIQIINKLQRLSPEAAADAIITGLIMRGISEKENELLELMGLLNEPGQEKAIEQLELLTKIPEYQKED